MVADYLLDSPASESMFDELVTSMDDSWFVSGGAIIYDLPDGLADISPVAVAGGMEGLTDSEVGELVERLKSRGI